MKFSFLIPTKNRLEYLKMAVDSILRQGYDDFEIIISDNASEQDYSGYLESLGLPQVTYSRREEPVSVTDNWNATVQLATGDYIIMLGDDDALAPGCIDKIVSTIDKLGEQDVIYMAAYHYCYPHVMPGQDAGYLAEVRNSIFLLDRVDPFLLPADEARSIALSVGDFRAFYGFNSQHFVFRGEFVRKLAKIGGIFQSPYPDTFAAVVSFLRARSIAVIPEPCILIGISPRSFGYYYFNDLLDEGYDFLGNTRTSADVLARVEDVVLPGDPNNTNWLVAIEAVREALASPAGAWAGRLRCGLGRLVASIRRRPVKEDVDLTEADAAATSPIGAPVTYQRYRLVQMITLLKGMYLDSDVDRAPIEEYASQLDGSERLIFMVLNCAAETVEIEGEDAIARFFEILVPSEGPDSPNPPLPKRMRRRFERMQRRFQRIEKRRSSNVLGLPRRSPADGNSNAPDMLRVNHRRYRLLQMMTFLKSVYLKGKVDRAAVDAFAARLDSSERVTFKVLRWALLSVESAGRGHAIRIFEVMERELPQFCPAQVSMLDIGEHSNIRDAFNWLERQALPAAAELAIQVPAR